MSAGSGSDSAAGSPPRQEHRLPFSSDAVRRSRHLLLAHLDGRGLGRRTLQDAVIVLGELVANGVEHGASGPDDTILVWWRLDAGELAIGVQDAGGGRSEPHVVSAGPEDARGRGLAMVQAIARAWHADTDSGTEVSAVVPAPVVEDDRASA